MLNAQKPKQIPGEERGNTRQDAFQTIHREPLSLKQTHKLAGDIHQHETMEEEEMFTPPAFCLQGRENKRTFFKWQRCLKCSRIWGLSDPWEERGRFISWCTLPPRGSPPASRGFPWFQSVLCDITAGGKTRQRKNFA